MSVETPSLAEKIQHYRTNLLIISNTCRGAYHVYGETRLFIITCMILWENVSNTNY